MVKKKPLYFAGISLMFASASSWAIEPPLLVKPPVQQEPDTNQPITELSPVEKIVGQVESQGDSTIKAIHFVGGTSLDLQLIAQDVNFLIGQPYQKDLVQIAIDKVSARFHDNGFPLAFATVGRNGFSDSKLTITVVEGYIIRSEIVVDDPHVKERIDDILADVLQEKPARKETLERAIALINDIPGYQFTLSLPRPKTLSGATSFRIEQKNREMIEPFVGYAMQKDSDKSMSVGLRLNANRSYLQSLTVNALVPIDNHDQQFYSANFTHALGSDGLSSVLNLTYYQDNEESELPINGNQVSIDNKIERQSANYDLSYPFILNKNQRLTAKVGLLYESEDREYHLSYNDTYLGQLDDSIRYLIASLYVTSQHTRENFSFSVGVGVNQSVPSAFDYTSDLGNSQLYDDGFRFYEMNVLSSYQLTSRYLVSLRGNGVYASESIVPSQRVSYGGVNFARGYPEGTLEGDRGYGAELKFMQRNSRKKYYLNPFILVDYANAEQVRLTLPYSELASAAVGFEAGYSRNVHLSFDYAKPLIEHHRFTRDVFNLSLRWKF
ncbi:POTRA domain-containing protein [Vibrio fluvialis]